MPCRRPAWWEIPADSDVEGHLGAVHRLVSSSIRGGAPARTVTLAGCSDAWELAAIAHGADADAARAAARRTSAFYTGEPVPD